MAFDELTFHNKLARPGTIVEVGANKGSMTAHFGSWMQQKVVAFEPYPPVYDNLVANITNAFDGRIPERVILRHEALGAKPGAAAMRIPRTRTGVIDEWASLAKTFEGFEGVEFDEIQVPVITIDSLDISDVTAIKIDAEGYEQEVLSGARRTIGLCRPILSVECEERHRTGCTYYVPGFMAALDYEAYWYDYVRDEFRPVSSFDRATMQQASSSPAQEQYGDFYIFIFYFIPRENHDLRLRLADCAPIRPF